MRILFMGTPDFAVPCLQRLLEDGHEICGVFTQPDKPRGRGYAVTPPPVAVAAAKANIPVLQPATLRDESVAAQVAQLRPDAIVVVAYGKILPEAILNIPPLGCVNVHASLLPRYRGAAPMQWAILSGETVTGVTTMLMAKGMDTGDMIDKVETPIGPDEDYGTLYARLSAMGSELLSRTMMEIAAGTAHREKQDDSQATFAPMIDKVACRLDFSAPAARVHDRVRALSPAPGARTTRRDQPLKVFASRLSPEPSSPGTPGELLPAQEGVGGIPVRCGDGRVLWLTQVQGAGGRRMEAAEYLRGHPVVPGETLGR